MDRSAVGHQFRSRIVHPELVPAVLWNARREGRVDRDERYPAGSVTPTWRSPRQCPMEDVLSVETNSVVTDLNYNSNGNFLHFKVSGENGTEGYMKVTISKTWSLTSRS